MIESSGLNSNFNPKTIKLINIASYLHFKRSIRSADITEIYGFYRCICKKWFPLRLVLNTLRQCQSTQALAIVNSTVGTSVGCRQIVVAGRSWQLLLSLFPIVACTCVWVCLCIGFGGLTFIDFCPDSATSNNVHVCVTLTVNQPDVFLTPRTLLLIWEQRPR